MAGTFFLTSGMMAPPAPPAEVWFKTQMTFTAWTGATWDLTDPTGGLLMTRGGVRGLDMPPYTPYRVDAPGVPGTRWRGTRAGMREVFWPVYVATDDGSQAWVELDSLIRRSLHPEHVGTWTVQAPGREARSLTIRFRERDDAYDLDPTFSGWAPYGMYFDAEWPYWQGPPITVQWDNAIESRDFYTPGTDWVYWLNSSFQVAGATVSNPGDVDAWPVWTIHGPCSSATVGIGNKTITVPFALSAGQSLTIDSRPIGSTAFQAIDQNGVSRNADMGEMAFAAIAPGEQVRLGTSLTGGGSIEMTMQPNYLGAW